METTSCSASQPEISANQNLNDLDDVPVYELDEIKHFLEVYKTLEPGKEVHGGDWVGHDAAEEEILASYKRYNETH